MSGLLDRQIEYSGLIFNEHIDALGVYDRDKENDTYLVEQMDISGVQIRDQREGKNLDIGGIFGVATKVFRRIALSGTIKATSDELLEDKTAILANVFDVEVAQQIDPTTRGEAAFLFYTPTLEPPAGESNPVRELIFARPGGFVRTAQIRSTALSKAFSVELLASDPRRYLATLTTITFNGGNGFSDAMPNWRVGMGIDSYPYVTINLTAAGAVDFTISDGVRSLVLDLSAVSGATAIAVDMQAMSIVNLTTAIEVPHYRTSDVDSFIVVPAGGSTWTITNTTNVSEVKADYRQART